MNLHNAVPAPPEPTEVTAENVACPECGNRRFEQTMHGRFNEIYWKRYDNGRYQDGWDGLDQDVDDTDPWYCYDGHRQPEAIQDFLNFD